MIKRIADRVRNMDPAQKFRKNSYAQCGEDIIVKFIFDSIGVSKPSYIDIGAHHPHYLNNTAILYETGSRGINIEPDPVLFRKFERYRKEDININAGIGRENGMLDFYLMSSPTLNSFSRDASLEAEKEGYKIVDVKKIQVFPLKEVLDKYSETKFPDFLSLDVEGLDMDILTSIDFTNNAPIVICVETISFSNTGIGEKDTAISRLLESNGYILYADTYINTIFVKRDKWQNR